MLEMSEVEGILDKKQLVYIEKQDTESKINGPKYKFNYREINYFKSEIENLFEDLEKAINEKQKSLYFTRK